MREILRHPRALGVAEMMNFPGVIAGDPDVLARMVAPHVDGHAPGVTRRARWTPTSRPASPPTTRRSPPPRRSRSAARGMWVLIREASNARNLRALLAMVREHGPDYCAFCTDDREPDFLYREGHIDQMCRIAVARGHRGRGRARDGLAARRARPRAARPRRDRARLRRRPGAARRPRVVRASSLVLKDGREPVYPAARAGGAARHDALACRSSFAIAGAPARVRVIEIEPGQLITGAGAEAPRSRDGHVVADPARDLAKIAVIERHHATGRVGLGLVRGFGLRAGAFASTVAHDAHNLVVVGVDDADMALCAARAQALGGGLVVARDGEVARRARAADRRAAVRRAARGGRRRARGAAGPAAASRAWRSTRRS